MKRFKRIVFAVLICASFVFGAPLAVAHVAGPHTIAGLISPLEVDMFVGDVRVTGQRPVVAAGSLALSEQLNSHFDEQFNGFLAQIPDNIRSVTVDFEVPVSDNFVNVLVNFSKTAATTEQYMLTTVIEADSLNIITFADVVGPNGTGLINQALSQRISANPARFSAAFAGVTANHAFYIDGPDAVLVFNEFELINARVGITKVRVDLDDIANVIVDADYQFVNEDGITFVRLRRVADAQTFDLHWNEQTQTVNITSEHGLNIYVTIGQRSVYFDERHLFDLEAAPQLLNDRTYLPLSFFPQLGLTPHIHPNGDITLSVYIGMLVISP